MTTVLLLEDNADMLKVLGMMLEQAGYKVIYARSAQEGLAVLKDGKHVPDVILCDMVMPTTDGMSVLTHVRSVPELHSIPFVLMSGYSSPEKQREAFALGADAFLVKPFPFASLNTIIRNLGIDTPAKV